MICLTGDVHHKSMKSCEQSKTKRSEIKIAEEYLAIAEKNSVKVSLFITGKTFKEEMDNVKTLLDYKNLEIGGHTYSALRPVLLHSLFKKVGFSYYGPRFVQEKDIKKTIHIIKRVAGKRITSWRTHSYLSDSVTHYLLRKNGIKTISDEVAKDKLTPYRRNDLVFLPINVLPDHEHIFHGCRDSKEVSRLHAIGWADDFGLESYTIRKWFEIVKMQVQTIIEKSGIATLLVHPLCMEVSDGLKTFKELCDFLSKYKSIFVREAENF